MGKLGDVLLNRIEESPQPVACELFLAGEPGILFTEAVDHNHKSLPAKPPLDKHCNRATCVLSAEPDGTSSWPSQSLRYCQARVTRFAREDTHASGSGLIPLGPTGGLVNGHDDGHHTAPAGRRFIIGAATAQSWITELDLSGLSVFQC
jgi:hypothetical protein